MNDKDGKLLNLRAELIKELSELTPEELVDVIAYAVQRIKEKRSGRDV